VDTIRPYRRVEQRLRRFCIGIILYYREGIISITIVCFCIQVVHLSSKMLTKNVVNTFTLVPVPTHISDFELQIMEK